MSKLIDITGQKFGRLTVIRREPNDKWENTRWLCKCSCGKSKIILVTSLTSGATKSCGCLQKEIIGNIRRLKSGLSTIRAIINNYKGGARSRGYNFNLTEKQFIELTQKDCFYCGTKPNTIAKWGHCYGEYIYNGLDRIENNKGYTIDNVVPCCFVCNRAKDTMTLQEFQNWIKKVYSKTFTKKGEIK
jgi:hypothetical protein